MFGVIPFTHLGLRLFSYCQHGESLDRMETFARGIQEFTIASVPFCEIRDRVFIDGAPPEFSGYSFHHKAILTYRVNGERFGFPIYAPREVILEEVQVKRGRKIPGRIQLMKRIKQEWGEYFASIYPIPAHAKIEFETGWLCR